MTLQSIGFTFLAKIMEGNYAFCCYSHIRFNRKMIVVSSYVKTEMETVLFYVVDTFQTTSFYDLIKFL